ncbi:MAG TPA: glycosyltransferase 61 family protein [Nocardioides sp.]|nr:glycosyltransferase 61 family protein [Nocardioides sp.]
MTTAAEDRDRLVRLRGLARRLPGPVRDALRPAVKRARDRRRAPQGPLESLDAIGTRTGTDKASAIHDYLGVYEQQLGHLRGKRFQLVEIGVHQGASTRMWAEFFSRAKVVGIDIDPACRRHADERIEILIGNQGRAAFLARLARRLRPLVLVDDGSHRWTHQIDTFRTLFPVLRPGGYFIVEDIHTSFGEDYAATYGTEGGETAYAYMASIAEGIVAGPRAAAPRDEFETYCRATIESIVFLKHSLIVRKKAFPQRRYLTRSVADVAPDAVEQDTGAPYERIPAELVGASPEVTAAFDGLLGSGPVAFEPARSAVLDDVTVVAGGIALHDGKVLDETLNAARNIRRNGPLYRPADDSVWVEMEPVRPVRVPAVPGRHHVLLKQTWDSNYGHWLIDSLPRLALLDKVHDPAECLFVVNRQQSDAMRQVVVDSLALAGVAEDQILFRGYAPATFERLTVLGTVARHPVAKSPLALSFLEQLGAQVPGAGEERIYVTRAKAARRRLVNHDEVREVLAAHGYRVVHPEDLDLAGQIALFRSATHVVADMGAALSNLAFSPPGVTVLALATESMEHDYFYDIVCHKSGRYRGLQGTAVEAPAHNGSDFRVDVALLEECLAWAHS